MAKRDDDLDQYLTEIGRFPLLSQEEERELAARVAAGDEEARTQLISCNLRLVVTIAKQYARQTRVLSLGDLINEGNLGLIKAAGRFDPDRGGKFSTYSAYWIRQVIRRALIYKTRMVRVPAYMVEMLSQWHRARVDLLQSLGRPPTLEEIADSCGIPRAKLRDIQRAMRAGALTGRGGDDAEETISLEEFVAAQATAHGASDVLAAELRTQDVDAILESCLSDREQLVIKMRYGLGDIEKPMTLRDVGRAIHLTRERVRQIEADAYRKLQVFLLGR